MIAPEDKDALVEAAYTMANAYLRLTTAMFSHGPNSPFVQTLQDEFLSTQQYFINLIKTTIPYYLQVAILLLAALPVTTLVVVAGITLSLPITWFLHTLYPLYS
jgi:hypothetical protein